MSTTRRGATAMLAAVWLVRAACARSERVTSLSAHTPLQTGDFDDMLRRGVIRVLMPYSRTFFFQDKGRFYGIGAEIGTELEKWLRKTYPTHKQKLVVALIPTSRDRLIRDLLGGVGDLAVGDITITPERQKLVAFSTPTRTGVEELVVTKAGIPPMASADDLSGQDIAARPGTSTYASLVSLNERLVSAGRAPATIIDLPGALEVEDMMEMVEAGLLPAIPAEDWIFDAWTSLIPGIMVHRKAVLRADASLAWPTRPDNPMLLATLNTFIAKVGGSSQNMRDTAAYYVKQVKKIHSATNATELKKFTATVGFFKKYGEQYGFDALMLVAQGYQESQLDQSTRSRAGAIGVMQLLPATGKDMGVGDITQAEANVHAGAKYMRHLLDTYLEDASFDEQNRTLFAFACYNAGPNKVAQLRKQAKDEGLNRNLWLDNVERIAAKRIGQETVRYVRNIYKYYIGYKLLTESQERGAAAKAAIQKQVADKPSGAASIPAHSVNP
jgi:membrane-bound lytic murein transglycosylase MltF